MSLGGGGEGHGGLSYLPPLRITFNRPFHSTHNSEIQAPGDPRGPKIFVPRPPPPKKKRNCKEFCRPQNTFSKYVLDIWGVGLIV